MDFVEEITLEKWEKIHEYKHEHKKDGWVFRGQHNADDKLETSLERARYFKLENAVHLETKLLREFKRRYHQYANHIPEDKDYLEWFSIMRHYEAPVRLLDFSYSIYIAAYFALEHGKDDCAVWAINSNWSCEQSRKILKLPDKYWKDIDEDDKDRLYMEKVFEFRDGIPDPCVSSINPFKLNQRLTLQQGTFLCPSNINKSFMCNLQAMEGHGKEENVIKIIIPKKIQNDALKKIKKMNISRATLFPGLEGFAKSLKVFEPPFLQEPS